MALYISIPTPIDFIPKRVFLLPHNIIYMSIRLIPHKKYKITWTDILSFSEWMHKDEILKVPETKIESVYIYVGKGKGGYCFAGEFNGNEYGNISIIPKGNLIKITLIK